MDTKERRREKKKSVSGKDSIKRYCSITRHINQGRDCYTIAAPEALHLSHVRSMLLDSASR